MIPPIDHNGSWHCADWTIFETAVLYSKYPNQMSSSLSTNLLRMPPLKQPSLQVGQQLEGKGRER